MTQPENRDHTFTCPHCRQNITAGITGEEDIPGAEAFHMEECRLGPVHRMVNFEVSLAEYGDAVCGDRSEQRRSSFPSSVTCEECLGRTPGLQLRGMLETVCSEENATRVEAPENIRAVLEVIRRALEEEAR